MYDKLDKIGIIANHIILAKHVDSIDIPPEAVKIVGN
jgi:hypothetical protein